MQFPIEIAFKLLTLAPKLYVTDASGTSLGFVRRKLFAFREAVTVFRDESEAEAIYKINADRIIDFNANYHLTSVSGRSIGYIRRRGVRSVWRAHYEVYLGDRRIFEIHEESALVRAIDTVIGEIPIIGLFTGFFLNPTYNVVRENGTTALRVIKRRAFLESLFRIEKIADIRPDEQECVMLALMMMILLERTRG